MKNEELIVDKKQARLYFYTKMYESGHTPTSLAELFGISRQAVSKILLGTTQPGPNIREMLDMEVVYRIRSNKQLPPGPNLPEVLKSRAALKASGPKRRSTTKRSK